MKVFVKTKAISEASHARKLLDERFLLAFARFRHKVDKVTVTLVDVNGPRGGLDMQCRILVKPIGLPSFVITERRANLREALDRGLYRAVRQFARQEARATHVGRRARQRLAPMPS